MAEYLVEYDATNFIEEEIEGADGNLYYEDAVDSFSDEVVIEADDEEEARNIAYERFDGQFDDFYVWSVRPTTMSEED